jgi:LCP family protein required for cell wall assembly
MSDEDPWKNWYQTPEPSADGGDSTRDMTVASPMPGVDTGDSRGRSGSGTPADSGAGRGWPSQPPPVSSPGSAGSPNSPGSPGRSAGAGYNSPGYRPAGYGAAGYGADPRVQPGGPPVKGGRTWRFWGQPGRRGRRIALIVGIVVVVIIVMGFGSYFWIDGKLNKSVSLPAFSGTSAGTNWLIVGSDARTGLTRSEIDKLHLGTDAGDASDSLMLLHTGSGTPVLISIPRDSYVDIPGHGMDKINAALAIGGPTLLAQTVESVTGLRIDHYMGIGFGGLVSVVNTVGGVRICLPTALDDSNSGVKLKAGCQNLNGTQSLAFVRDRHSFGTSDLQRIQDQRAFLKALLSKATSPGVYLNPFSAFPFASTAAGSISVDKGTSLYDLLQVSFALRNPQTGTVPIADDNLQTPDGDAVEWNRAQALQLFDALQAGKPVPKGLLSGTQVGKQDG